ncbi:MAG TPA: hypothetical protein PLK28_08150 [Candidatus Rifleibacterium sp.]|nr:hypothetical protein [Candidatus Rifleibacterium sp.]
MIGSQYDRLPALALNGFSKPENVLFYAPNVGQVIMSNLSDLHESAFFAVSKNFGESL